MKQSSLFSQYRTMVSISIIVSALVGYLAGAVGNPSVLAQLGLEPPPAATTSAVNPQTNAPVQIVSEEQQVIGLVEKAKPAVVSIIITKDLPKYETFYVNPFGGDNSPFGNDPFFQQFFGNQFPNFQIPQQRQNGTQKQQVGAGSGFIVAADGTIVTNRHVVDDEKADYTVVLNDGAKHPAKVLARDPVKDIAIIKIDAKASLPFLTLGNDADIKIGQTVVAIGNALGQFSNTVSKGVISGMSRSITAGSGFGQTEQLTGVLQTDAAINPGNSGGPLLNLKGEVLGMNTAIAQGAQSIGFAIPVSEIQKDLTSVRSSGKIVYPYLGVRFVMIDEDLRKVNNLSVDNGALVLRGEQRTDLAVVPGSPADKAGLEENDIITKVNNTILDQSHPLNDVIARFKPGDTVTLTVLHKGSQREVRVTLEERK